MDSSVSGPEEVRGAATGLGDGGGAATAGLEEAAATGLAGGVGAAFGVFFPDAGTWVTPGSLRYSKYSMACSRSGFFMGGDYSGEAGN